MNPKYTILEHPADIGIEAQGSTLAEAFQNAATALMSIIIDLTTIDSVETRSVKITASDRDQLLIKWLSEILYLYDGQGFVCNEFTIDKLKSTYLSAKIGGENFSGSKHKTKLDVKAVTYHQLKIEEKDGKVIVRVFLDI